MKARSETIFYVSIGAGMALGTSSFTMLSGLFEIVNSLWVAAAILLAGGFCILIASSVAELASMYPSSPGIRTYLKVALGNRVSLFLVHLYLIFIVLIAGVESYVFAQVITMLWPQVPALAVVLVMLTLVISINMLGLEVPRSMQIFTAFILIASIMAFGIYGMLNSPPEMAGALHFDPGENSINLKLLPAGIAMAIFLFIGFEWVTPLGIKPESYQRRIPYSMLIAIVINMVAYSFFVSGIGSQMTEQEIVANSIPQVPYFAQLFGENGMYFAGGLSILAIFSTFNAGVLGASRLVFALTREGNLPKWCARISYSSGAPIGAIGLLGGLSIISSIIVLTYDLELVAAVIGSSIICFVYAAFVLSVVKLRKSEPDMKRPFRSSVPSWARWIIIVLLPLMGLQSLVSQPGLIVGPLLGMLLFIILALLLTKYSQSLALKRTQKPKAQA